MTAHLVGVLGSGPAFTRSVDCSSCGWRDGAFCACRPLHKFIQTGGRVADVRGGRAHLHVARLVCGGLYWRRR